VPKLTVKQLGTFRVKGGETLLEVLRRHGVPVAAGCGGLGLCGLCRVKILQGELSPPSTREVELLGQQLDKGWRLACQAKVLGDVEVEIPLRRATAKFRVRPLASISTSVLFAPFDASGGEPSYEERLLETLKAAGVEASRASLSALNTLSSKVSGLAVIVESEVVDIADTYVGYGLAVDVGTTSVAASLVDLLSGAVVAEAVTLNSQLKFGADIISRIRHSITEPNGVRQLQEAAVNTVNELISKLGVASAKIYRVVVAGNSVMQHLFFGVNPGPLGFLPFRPVYRRPITAKGKALGLNVHPDAHVESLPILGGYVGGDVVGDLLTARLSEYNTAMLIDVGTNGEIVLKRGDEYVAASTPAGPAFEGVGLHSGMMAIEGAIEKVRVSSGGEPEYEVIGGGEAKGICGSGYVDLLAELLRAGLLSKDGRLARGPRVKELNGVLAYVIDERKGIALTQQDIRKLQLAVGAVKFTAKFLLKKMGVSTEDLEKVVVAGDFGYHLDARNAMEVGLLPKVDDSAMEYIGNGSLTGAELYMISRDAREEALRLASVCRVLDVPRDDRSFIAELTFGW
jgi:uncharacterized 2Fe-2S/4Fe-4S cluster protein (DUF4445 family)